MEFTSQICTTEEQSKRLLVLGLKKETADCILVENPFEKDRYVMFPIVDVDETLENEMSNEPIPAWSLHRLIEMMPSTLQDLYELDFSKRGVYYADFSNGSFNFIQSFAKPATTLYDNIINCIEWLIKEGYFNKEYLE